MIDVTSQRYRVDPELLRGLFACLICLGAVRALAGEQGGVKVEEFRWGFDGTMPSSLFAPVSVLLRNDSSQLISGELQLECKSQNECLDLPIKLHFDLSGQSKKWVQFFPQGNSVSEWKLHFDNGETFSLDRPQMGPPAVVQFLASGQRRRGFLKGFLAEIFPTNLNGLDGLRSVVMDEAPSWQLPQQAAFLDWLRRGGRLYLTRSMRGDFPKFSGALAVLNNDSYRLNFGIGSVEKLDVPVSDITKEMAEEKLGLQPTKSAEQTSATQPSFSQTNPNGTLLWNRNMMPLGTLSKMAHFELRWWLIYLLVLAYLATHLLYGYRIGTTTRKATKYYVVYLGTILAFGVLFAEQSTMSGISEGRVRRMTIAHQLDDEQFDVTHYTSLASPFGAEVRQPLKDPHALISTGLNDEAVRGLLTVGPPAELRVQLPVRSTLTLIERATLDYPDLHVDIQDFKMEGNGLSYCAVKVRDFDNAPRLLPLFDTPQVQSKSDPYQFPKTPENKQGSASTVKNSKGKILAAFIAEGSRMHHLKSEAGFWKTSRVMTIKESVFDPNWTLFGFTSLAKTEAENYDACLRTLIGNSFSLTGSDLPDALTVPSGFLRLFLYAELPPDFQWSLEKFADRSGRILFVLDRSIANPNRPALTP